MQDFRRRIVSWISLFLATSSIIAADFNVTSPGFFYAINGNQPNPGITLTRGQTYTFAVNTDSIHPFEIATTGGVRYDNGVANNNISSGTITFTVPADAPDTLAYFCSIHFFGDTMTIVNGGPAADFAVTSPGFFFEINGSQPNPTITLTRGQTYTFAVNTDPIHPFEIVSDLSGTAFANGVTNNNIFNGVVTFSVSSNAPSTLYYLCSIHFFSGQINIVDPPKPPDFSVTSPDFYFLIAGQQNPPLTLMRGKTYNFAINTDPVHPFEIVSDLFGTPYNEGVANNNINSGTLTFTVPLDAPGELYYICTYHFFGNTITIIDPPQLPLVQILSIAVSPTNVVMKSRGTNGNGWLAIPEFSSNIVVSNWAVVPSFTNSFLSGTNTTVFNRLDPICGPNVYLRIKNVKP